MTTASSAVKYLVRVVAHDPSSSMWATHAVFTFERGGQSLVGFEAATLGDLAVPPYRDAAHAKTGRGFCGVGWFWVSGTVRGQLVRKVKAAYPGVWKTITVEVPKRTTPSRSRRLGRS